jgi:beta-lactamase class A
MISQSDNTATDALIDVVGRERIEPHAGHNRPLLTTREMFILHAGDEALIERYQDGDEAARRALLGEIAQNPLPSADAIARAPARLGIEWHYSAAELCELIEKVHALPAMHVNPGVAARDDFPEIAFKGGGDMGVLNGTTRVVDQAGHAHCVTATWNHENGVDKTRFFALYGSVLAALRESGNE